MRRKSKPLYVGLSEQRGKDMVSRIWKLGGGPCRAELGPRGAAWLAGAGFLGTQSRDPQSQELTPGEGVPTSRYYHLA